MVHLHRVYRAVKENHGFIRDVDLKIMAEQDKMRKVLVRCGNCRFICAAQDAKYLIGIIEREGSDHIRDVSLPAGDPIYSA